MTKTCLHCLQRYDTNHAPSKYCGDCTKTIRHKRILRRDDHTCVYCGQPGNALDHIIPRSALNANGTYGNLVTACASCNGRKHYRACEVLGHDTAKILAEVSRRNTIHGYSDSQLLYADAPTPASAIIPEVEPTFAHGLPASELASRALMLKTRTIGRR